MSCFTLAPIKKNYVAAPWLNDVSDGNLIYIVPLELQGTPKNTVCLVMYHGNCSTTYFVQDTIMRVMFFAIIQQYFFVRGLLVNRAKTHLDGLIFEFLLFH